MLSIKYLKFKSNWKEKEKKKKEGTRPLKSFEERSKLKKEKYIIEKGKVCTVGLFGAKWSTNFENQHGSITDEHEEEEKKC